MLASDRGRGAATVRRVRTAFVTGGSGFIGGALDPPPRRARAGRVRALARSDAAAGKVARRGAEAVRGELSDAGRHGRRRRAAPRSPSTRAAHARRLGPARGLRRGNVTGTRQRHRRRRAAPGCAALVHVGTEAALLAGEPLFDDRRARSRCASTRRRCTPSTKARGRGARARRQPRRPRDRRGPPALRLGQGDTTLLPAAERDGPQRALRVDRRRPAPHVDDARRQRRRGPDARRRARHAAAAPTSSPTATPVVFRDFITRLLATQGARRPQDRSLPRPVAHALAVGGGDRLAARCRCPGRPPLTRFAVLALRAGDDDRHLARAGRARLRAGDHDRRGPGRNEASHEDRRRRPTTPASTSRSTSRRRSQARGPRRRRRRDRLAGVGRLPALRRGGRAARRRAATPTAAVLACGSGVGVAIVANKVDGVRAVNAHDPSEAEMARRHNDANVVTLSGARLAPERGRRDRRARSCAPTFEGGRHARRVGQIAELDDSASRRPRTATVGDVATGAVGGTDHRGATQLHRRSAWASIGAAEERPCPI